MSISYRLLYLLGFTPWDQGVIRPELIEVVDGPDALPVGRALDIGCGTGTQSIYLAQHGWQVTGVDFVRKALQVAQRKAAAVGVAPTWVEGDVTHLPELGIRDDFALLFDFGCFHGLSDRLREAYVRGITSVAATNADFLLFAFNPGKRGPMPRGVSSEEIAVRFGKDWELIWTRKATGLQLSGPLRHADPRWYRLRKRQCSRESTN